MIFILGRNMFFNLGGDNMMNPASYFVPQQMIYIQRYIVLFSLEATP